MKIWCAIALLVFGCSSGSNKPSSSNIAYCESKYGCGDTYTPTPEEIELAIQEQAEDMKARISRGELKLKYSISFYERIPIRFVRCSFPVGNPKPMPPGVLEPPDNCCDGVYQPAKRYIQVRCNTRERCLALIKWEYQNFFLHIGGRYDLAY